MPIRSTSMVDSVSRISFAPRISSPLVKITVTFCGSSSFSWRDMGIDVVSGVTSGVGVGIGVIMGD